MLDVSRTTCSSTTGTGLLIKLTTSIGGLSENGTADKSAKDLNGDLLRAWKNNHSRYYLLLLIKQPGITTKSPFETYNII